MGLFPLTPTKKALEEEIPPPTPEQLQVLLDNARPSRRRDSYFLSAGAADFETAHAIAVAQCHGHGIFVCCYGHDNILKYHDGEYPFLELKCGRCSHVLCKNCLTTAIITPLKGAEQAAIAKMDVAKQRKHFKDFFQVCPNCGLSRLAQMRNPDHHGERLCWVPVASHSHSELCSCGTSAKSDWLKFVIGDPTPYRLDPAKALDDLKNRWIDWGLKEKYGFESEQAAQKPPQAKWEALGRRRAQADKTSAPHTDRVSKFKANQPSKNRPHEPPREVAESHSIDQPVQDTPKLRPSFRRQPEYLTLVQHSPLTRHGAVRGNCTPRSGRERSFRTDFSLTTCTASSSEIRAINLPEVLTHAEILATAEEHRRLNEPSHFVSEDDGPYTPSTAPSQKNRIDVRQSTTKRDGKQAVDQRALDRVNGFLSGASLSAVFDLDSMQTLTLTDRRTP